METKLTPLYLKTVSQKFDLETIFILNLKDKLINGGIGSLGECINIMNLNLSSNKITILTGIENLVNLRILDLSNNKLTTVESLKGCINLDNLDLSGNLIKDCKPIERISSFLTKLVNLKL
jgi:protein phosphatase 1 regulatory subunit 7